MNARRRLRRARIASPDLNASAFVIETAITDNAPPFNQPWPPTGLETAGMRSTSSPPVNAPSGDESESSSADVTPRASSHSVTT